MIERARLAGVALVAALILGLAGCHSPTKPDDPNHGIPLEGVPHNASKDPLPIRKHIVTRDGVQTRLWVEIQEMTIIQVQPVPEFAAMNCNGDCFYLTLQTGFDDQTSRDRARFQVSIGDSSGRVVDLGSGIVSLGDGQDGRLTKELNSLQGMTPTKLIVTGYTDFGPGVSPAGTAEFDMVHY